MIRDEITTDNPKEDERPTTKKNNAFVLLLLFFVAVYLVPTSTLANGGDQRIVEGDYMINLSRAPFTPRVGDKTQMLASFVDLKTNKLVSEDMIVNIRISRFGSGSGKREFIYEQDYVKVTGGVLDFSYIFRDAGLHEIFFDFAFASHPEVIHESPDFLLDVQELAMQPRTNWHIILWTIGGAAFGFIVGRFLRPRFKTAL